MGTCYFLDRESEYSNTIFVFLVFFLIETQIFERIFLYIIIKYNEFSKEILKISIIIQNIFAGNSNVKFVTDTVKIIKSFFFAEQSFLKLKVILMTSFFGGIYVGFFKQLFFPM